jgi:hypothetical protein
MVKMPPTKSNLIIISIVRSNAVECETPKQGPPSQTATPSHRLVIGVWGPPVR